MSSKFTNKKPDKKADAAAAGLLLYTRYKLYGIKRETWEQLPRAIQVILLDTSYIFSCVSNSGIIFAIAVEFARLGVPRKILWQFLLAWVMDTKQLKKLKVTLNYAYGQVSRERREENTPVPETYATELKPLDLSKQHLQVLAALKRTETFYGKDVFPASYSELVAATGIVYTTLVYYIKLLIEHNFIELVTVGRGRQPSQYRLLSKAREALDAEERQVQLLKVLKIC